MQLEEIKLMLDDLGINLDGNIKHDEYVIDLLNSQEYSEVYSILDSSCMFDVDEEQTEVSENACVVEFFNSKFYLRLTANFVTDIYKLIIGEE